MNVVHTHVMNYKRVTVSLPIYVYDDLLLLLPTGGISSYVAEAVEDKILDTKLKPKTDPFDEFLNLRKITTKISDIEIMQAIHKGRT